MAICFKIDLSPRIKNAFSLNVLTAFGIRECFVHCVANDIHLDLASLTISESLILKSFISPILIFIMRVCLIYEIYYIARE